MPLNLPIKPPPRALDTDDLELVWPGDSSVIYDESDIEAWCRKGGREGLVFKSGVEPTVIVCRRLTTRELTEVEACHGANRLVEAARFGIKRITGITLGTERRNGVLGLDERTIDILSHRDLWVGLRWDILLRLEFEAKGLNIGSDDEADAVPTPLAHAVGAHILGATFRGR